MVKSSAAERMRRYRDRKRRGRCVVPIEIDRGEMADDLVELGLLAEWDSENHSAIQSAIKEALKKLRRYA
jgi:hypothetical protein